MVYFKVYLQGKIQSEFINIGINVLILPANINEILNTSNSF